MAVKENRKIIYSLLSFLIPFIIYIVTIAPTISWIDSDELAAVSTLLGVAHPTGYPLFTILGKVFTFFPAGDEVYRLNLMSAVISSFTILIFFNLMVFILTEFRLLKSDKLLFGNQSKIIVYNISLTSALLLAFSTIFWDNGNVIEVYSLHTFFLVLLIFIFLKAINYDNDQSKDSTQNKKYLILFAFVSGLSFSNHLTTLFLIFGILYLYFTVFGFERSSFNRLFILLIPLFAGLTLYIYLFIRADNSLMSWGQTYNFQNFIDHITGKQYETRMFTSFEDYINQIGRYFQNYLKEFSYLHLFLLIPGCIELFRLSKKIFYFSFILFASNIIFAGAYTIYDVYSYFLLSSVITALWSGFGILYFIKKFSSRSISLSYVSIILVFIPMLINYQTCDKSNDYILKDYNFNIFNSAPENSIIISNYTPTFYFQHVKKIRTDLIFINRDYLYNKWYVNSLINTYPELYTKCKNEFDIFSIELSKLIENKSKYLSPKTEADNQAILKYQKAMRDLLNSVIKNNISERTVFTTLEIDEVNDEKFGTEYRKIPQGVLLKLENENNKQNYQDIDLKYDISFDGDYFKNYVMTTYYKANINQAKYLMDNLRYEKADLALIKALELRPDSQEVRQLQQKLNQLKLKK